MMVIRCPSAARRRISSIESHRSRRKLPGHDCDGTLFPRRARRPLMPNRRPSRTPLRHRDRNRAPRGLPTYGEAMTITRRHLAALTVLGVLVACGPNSDQVVFQLEADRFANSEWSDPVNLGAPVNSSVNDMNAAL